MADKIQKSIEFKGDKAAKEINKITKSLERTITALLSVQYAVNKVNFDGLTTSLQKFVKDFSKISNMSKEVESIRVMAQALNRFKMVAIELNRADFSVSFEKITKGIYSFMDSVNRISSLEKNIMIVAELGRALNRLVNTSVKLQNMKVSFTSITQAIYAFVGSILRIKDLDTATTKLEKLANVMDRLKKSSQGFNFTSLTKKLNKVSSTAMETNKNFKAVDNTQKSMAKTMGTLDNALGAIAKGFRALNLVYIYHWAKRLGSVMYDLVKVYASYQENINLATVAYGKLNGQLRAITELYPFVEKMSTAFGLNESELIRSVGLFKQMANAMQLTAEQGDLLSKGLTKMAYDISSLYNISFDRAMSALQSSLVGKDLPLALVIVLANLFNCVKVLIKWFISKIIRRKVLMFSA